MSWLKKTQGKFRFAFEIAVLLLLALYVTVQAGGLGDASAAPANLNFASATSTVPGLLNYQGYLTDSGGAPLDGAYAIKFAIYDALTGGAELWSETQLAVQINDGQLSALLGETEPISPTLFATYPDTFIGVTLGSDPEMTPRQRIHSVPYAMHAMHATYADIPAYIMSSTTEYAVPNDNTWHDDPSLSITQDFDEGMLVIDTSSSLRNSINEDSVVHMRLLIDGVQKAKTDLGSNRGWYNDANLTLHWLESIEAGEHTITVQWLAGNNYDGWRVSQDEGTRVLRVIALGNQ
jgi:hypothetical protein